MPCPSWVSYAAQASLIGMRAHFVPTRAVALRFAAALGQIGDILADLGP